MPASTDYPSVVTVTSATIANGAAASSAIDLSGTTLTGIQMPGAFTGASVTFQVATSLTGTYQTLIGSSGSALTATVSASKYLALNPADFAGVQFVKIVSSANEGGARTLEISSRPM